MSNPSTTADDILRCARVLVARGGYDSFSYADISDVVGIRKASIHHHFPSKARLVEVVVAQYRAEARDGLAALSQLPDPRAALTALVDFWANCLQNGALSFCICAMLASELPMVPPEVAAEVRGHFEDLTNWVGGVLQQAVAQGQLQLRGDPAVEAGAIVAAIHGAMVSARSFDRSQLFQQLAQTAIDRLDWRTH